MIEIFQVVIKMFLGGDQKNFQVVTKNWQPNFFNYSVQ
jgi:hypothetical protein